MADPNNHQSSSKVLVTITKALVRHVTASGVTHQLCWSHVSSQVQMVGQMQSCQRLTERKAILHANRTTLKEFSVHQKLAAG